MSGEIPSDDVERAQRGMDFIAEHVDTDWRATEPRTVKAAAICAERGIARCVLLGDEAFPDLNTGNTPYKAVQRSARVISIAPMLQGLRRPVNDLSRGASVSDIVYTIAITAIQADQHELRAT